MSKSVTIFGRKSYIKRRIKYYKSLGYVLDDERNKNLRAGDGVTMNLNVPVTEGSDNA